MKRLFLWLWFVTGACLLVSVFSLNHLLDRIYTPLQERVFVEQVRGQVYALRSGLAGLDRPQQQQRVAQWQPHYGIALSLLDAPPALDDEERSALRGDGFIVRERYQQVLLPIEGADGRWLQLRFPGEVQMTLYMTAAAYLCILLLVGACLYAWVRLLWRDLEALRGHADRIGAGDLQARAQVSPRSQIRVIVEHSNRMAARVAELVQRQRDLTHAISHELRTPIARLAFGLDLMQDSNDPARRAHLAAGLHGDLAELNRLVSELLAYERLEHPNDAEPMQRIEANDWLQACMEDARRDAERAGLVLQVWPSALPRVDAEPRLLQLALSNLVGNAMRYARTVWRCHWSAWPARPACAWMTMAPASPKAIARRCCARSPAWMTAAAAIPAASAWAWPSPGASRFVTTESSAWDARPSVARAWKCTGQWLPAERRRPRLQLLTTPAQLRTDWSPASRHAGDPAARAGCARCTSSQCRELPCPTFAVSPPCSAWPCCPCSQRPQRMPRMTSGPSSLLLAVVSPRVTAAARNSRPHRRCPST